MSPRKLRLKLDELASGMLADCIHYTPEVGRRLCGADYLCIASSAVRSRVTCADCLRAMMTEADAILAQRHTEPAPEPILSGDEPPVDLREWVGRAVYVINAADCWNYAVITCIEEDRPGVRMSSGGFLFSANALDVRTRPPELGEI